MKKLMVKGMLAAMDVKEKAIGIKDYAFDAVRNRKAQGMIEWALIIVLIAVVAIVGLTIVGKQINGKLGTIGQKLQ